MTRTEFLPQTFPLGMHLVQWRGSHPRPWRTKCPQRTALLRLFQCLEDGCHPQAPSPSSLSLPLLVGGSHQKPLCCFTADTVVVGFCLLTCPSGLACPVGRAVSVTMNSSYYSQWNHGLISIIIQSVQVSLLWWFCAGFGCTRPPVAGWEPVPRWQSCPAKPGPLWYSAFAGSPQGLRSVPATASKYAARSFKSRPTVPKPDS